MTRELRREVLSFIMACAPLALAASDAQKNEVYTREIVPILREFCITCHSTKDAKGELDLEQFKSLSEIRKHGKIWSGVIEQINLGEMPPKKKPQPTDAQKEKLLAWVRGTLDDIALANAGDPGPVLLRRLSNAEYTYTLRDLTGVESLDPAKEFPVDGAAGEGFTNTGQSLVMSPSLFTKYFDAGKDVASHAVLLPDGLRFSAKTSRRDHTEEILTEIRAFYRAFTEPNAGMKMNLQGVVFDEKTGGILPLEKYLAATIAIRDGAPLEKTAQERGLSAKYLATLLAALNDATPSPILDGLRAKWRTAKAADAKNLAAEIGAWQKALWTFHSVGNIGTKKGPKAWMEALSPVAATQEIRTKLPAPQNGAVTLYLSSYAPGGGTDAVVWQNPRLVATGRPDVPVRELREICHDHVARRERAFGATQKALAAMDALSGGAAPLEELAKKHGVDADILGAWAAYVGAGADAQAPVKLLTPQIKNAGKHEFIQGWGQGEPNVLANSSDTQVRVPGVMRPRSIAVHPSPKLKIVAGWRSPAACTVDIESLVIRAHPECGNGVNWSLELRRGAARVELASGPCHDTGEKKAALQGISVRPGDWVVLAIDPRNNDHGCDLTAANLVLTNTQNRNARWSLWEDVSPDILAGNPHADRQGNKDVWHFFTEATDAPATGPRIAAASLLGRWMLADTGEPRARLAGELQTLLLGAEPGAKDSPDAMLYRQMTALGGPLLRNVRGGEKPGAQAGAEWGLDPALFGKHPGGAAREKDALCVAPGVVEIRIPAEFAAGCEFVTTAQLDAEASPEACAQFRVSGAKPAAGGLSPDVPLVAREGSAARVRFEAAYESVRQLFPAALCYIKIVPADSVITLQLFYREDHHFVRLMLDDAQAAKLDQLWKELRFVSQDALTLVDAFEQLWQYATQDGDPKSLDPLREPILQGAAAFRQKQVDAQPSHVEGVIAFADRAYRRPITQAEKDELRSLYNRLRQQELPHEDAVRLMIARVLVAPAFLYRAEKPGPGTAATAVNDFELASRLSYFLWSSMPDTKLRAMAAAGKLREPAVLAEQTKRMLRDPKVRRMAVEFGCVWLHIHGFDELSEKSERHFPTFTALRGAMYEEPIQFFTDLFQNDRSILSLLDADHTFLNEELAKHYGIANVKGAEWRRVDGLRAQSRGGILAQAATLAKQSGASRTSPILRGNWIAEVLLGDKLPRPPKDVPPLPEDEANEKLTMRQLTEKHSSDARCYGCHKRIDPYGFSLEAFDAIGRKRERDLGDRPIETSTTTLDGTKLEGLNGLRNYLLTTKRDAFTRQFLKKLLGYSLGRAAQLSDETLIRELQGDLQANGFRIGPAVEKIVLSPPFRNIRGMDAPNDE